VTAHFNDKDGHPVDIEVTVDARPLRKGGLTPQSGHAATRHFLVFFREQEALAVRNRVVINGQDFSFNTDEGVEGQYRFKAAYSANITVVSLPFTTTRFRYEHEQLSSSAGRVFVKANATDDRMRYLSTAPGLDPTMANQVTLWLSAQGGLSTYAHQAGAHTFAIRFDPPLLLGPAETPPPVTYRMSLDDASDLVTGQLRTRHDGGRIVLEWRHAQPLWAQGSPFTSVMRLEEGGYQLEVRPLQ
jgi:hypothetical protein